MRHNLFYILSLLIIFSVGCANLRKAHRYSPPADSPVIADTSILIEDNVRAILNKLPSIDYTTFSGKAAVSFTANGSKSNVDAKIQLHKDSLIWISVTGPLGIEGARLLITPDSVRIMDKLHKEYTAAGVAHLQQLTGIPVDFYDLQQIILGNAVQIDETKTTFSHTSNLITISNHTDDLLHTLLITLPDYVLTQQSISTDTLTADNPSQHLNYLSARFIYADYENKKGKRFSVNRQVEIKSSVQIDIRFIFKTYEFDQEISTPFSVPTGYKRKNNFRN